MNFSKHLFLFLGTFLALASCQIPTDEETILSKDRKYPFFNVGIKEFFVSYEEELNIAENDNPNRDHITVEQKELMLGNLDIVRFVINTPEFKERVLRGDRHFQSARDATYTTPEGKVRELKYGDYYNEGRLLVVLRYAAIQTKIRKYYFRNAAAMGTVGKCLYLKNYDDPAYASDNNWVGFPSTQNWDEGGYLQGPYIASLLFHEILHNLGFGHRETNDPVYGLQGLFDEVYRDPKWQEKYASELAKFTPYYPIRHKSLLQSDTYWDAPPLVNSYISPSKYPLHNTPCNDSHPTPSYTCTIEDGIAIMRIEE